MNDVILPEGSISPRCIPLWPGAAPGAVGDTLLDQPMMSVHLPEQPNGCGILVCPGGGYRTLAADHEGLQVAMWLNRRGIAAFVLRYRVAPTYHSSVSIQDGERAMRLVRANAAEFGIDKARVGALGFSAGGHLVCALASRNPRGAANDQIDKERSQPDFVVPVYAVTNGLARGKKADEYTPTDTIVTAGTSPAFVVTTHEDAIVSPTQSTLFYNALHAAGVKAELHIFNDGDHGLGLMPGDPDAGQWPLLLMRWLRRRGFLIRGQRTAVVGRVTVDGAVPGVVWVTLVPRNECAPIARVRINRATGGHFKISEADGPVPGAHDLVVTHTSEQVPSRPDGIYTLHDAAIARRTMQVERGGFLHLDMASAEFLNPAAQE